MIMKSKVFSIFALSLALSVSAFAASTPSAKFNLIGAKDLATLMASRSTPTVFDVNNQEVREKDGVIPGAKLLESSSKYDIAKELPPAKNSQLVFYCANTQCTASHKAAERAMEAGYNHVSVMSDGIQGWAKAGQPVTKLSALSKTPAH
jgi:rhodanese-related sulfurtransferase